MLGVFLLRRWGFQPALRRLHDVVLLLVVAALLSTSTSAAIGVTSAWLGGVIPSATFWSVWWTWWIGDALGDLVIAPVISCEQCPERLRGRLILIAASVAGGTRGGATDAEQRA